MSATFFQRNFLKSGLSHLPQINTEEDDENMNSSDEFEECADENIEDGDKNDQCRFSQLSSDIRFQILVFFIALKNMLHLSYSKIAYVLHAVNMIAQAQGNPKVFPEYLESDFMVQSIVDKYAVLFPEDIIQEDKGMYMVNLKCALSYLLQQEDYMNGCNFAHAPDTKESREIIHDYFGSDSFLSHPIHARGA